MRTNGLLPPRIEGVRSPALASDSKLRMCNSERDAVLASIAMCGLTYTEIGARCGVTKQAVYKWARKGVPEERITAFCNATGTLLVKQQIALEQFLRDQSGHPREHDRIMAIARAA